MRIPFAGGLDRRQAENAQNRPALVRHACPCRTRGDLPVLITSRTTRRPRAGSAGKEAAGRRHCGSPTAARYGLRPARGRYRMRIPFAGGLDRRQWQMRGKSASPCAARLPVPHRGAIFHKLTITSRTTRRPRAGGAGKEAAVGEHCGSPTAARSCGLREAGALVRMRIPFAGGLDRRQAMRKIGQPLCGALPVPHRGQPISTN